MVLYKRFDFENLLKKTLTCKSLIINDLRRRGGGVRKSLRCNDLRRLLFYLTKKWWARWDSNPQPTA